MNAGRKSVALVLVLGACGARTGLLREGGDEPRGEDDVAAKYLVFTFATDPCDSFGEVGVLTLGEEGSLDYAPAALDPPPGTGHEIDVHFQSVFHSYHDFPQTPPEDPPDPTAITEIIALPEFHRVGKLTRTVHEDPEPGDYDLLGCVLGVSPERAFVMGGRILVLDPRRGEEVGVIDSTHLPDLYHGGRDCAVAGGVGAAWAHFDAQSEGGALVGGLLLLDLDAEDVLDADPLQAGTNVFPTAVPQDWHLRDMFAQGHFLYLLHGYHLERFDVDRRASDGIVLSREAHLFLQPRAILDDGDWVAFLGEEMARVDPDDMSVTPLGDFGFPDPALLEWQPSRFVQGMAFASAPDGNFVAAGRIDFGRNERWATLRDGRTGAILARTRLPNASFCGPIEHQIWRLDP